MSELEGNKRIQVMDASSRTVLHTSTAGQRMDLDVQHLPDGGYMVAVIANAKTSTLRVVVQH